MLDFARLAVAACAEALAGDTIAAGLYRAGFVLWICLVSVTFVPSKETP